MRVHEYGVLTSEGDRVSLLGLARDRPLALVFLRHLGCIFCRQNVAELRDALPHENIVFVTMSEPTLTARFKQWTRSPHPFLCDPERRLYESFDVPSTTAGGIFTVQVARRALKAYREGHRNSLSFDDQLQLGGTYVLDRTGEILASFPGRDISDNPTPETLEKILRAPYPAYLG